MVEREVDLRDWLKVRRNRASLTGNLEIIF